MLRALFSKTGKGKYLSHLDLMRLLQRAFQRAGLPLTHTQGFTPRPSVSIALPMSLGMESLCELLDFQLEGETPPLEEIRDRLNRALVPGVEILKVYEGGRKIRELRLLESAVTLEYDQGVPPEAAERIAALFRRPALPVEKKSKSGPVEQDIIPLIRRIAVRQTGAGELELRALTRCQEPSMNPMQLAQAVDRYLPEIKPDFARCLRLALYDEQEHEFY